jgi:ABC-2 type transport system ATP-binding protein
MTKNYIFEVEKLSKSFKNNLILDSLSFKIEEGKIIGIVGKSGAGKSTLMKILSGMIKSYSGSIILNNSYDKKNFSYYVGFSFQPYSLYEELSLFDNLIYFGKIYGLDKKTIMKRAKILFKVTDLDVSDLKKVVSSLSGGMKKRFDIVCSLLHDPKILIMDEPTAGLDPLRRKDIVKVIKKINSIGVTVIISSHIMSDIEGVCDEVMILNNGKIAIQDTPENIKSELLENEMIYIESSPGNYKKIVSYLSSFNILHCEYDSEKMIIYTPESEIIIHFVIHLFENNDESIERIKIIEPDLGDVFDKLNSQSEPKLLRKSIIEIDKFVYDLVGKHYTQDEISNIMINHNWPKEISKILVSRQFTRKLK